MARREIPVPTRSRYIFDDLANSVDDASVFTLDYYHNSPYQSNEPDTLPSYTSQVLNPSSSITFSDLSTSSCSRQQPRNNPLSCCVSIMSTLIGDLEDMSDNLSEIQSDIKNLGLSKMSPDIPATPRFIYTPATPDLNSEEQEVVELEDWEIEQKLREMTSDVELMYLEIVEMAEEGYFPDGVPSFLHSDDQLLEKGEDSTLEPDDVMRLLREMEIPETLEEEDEDCWPDSSSSEEVEANTIEVGTNGKKLSQTWSTDFDSYPSLPTASESGDDVRALNTPPDSDHHISIVDDTFIQSFQVAVSPLSQLIRSHSPRMETPVKRPRRPSPRIQPSPTISFAPAPSPSPETITPSPSFRTSSASMFSEPSPLIPFSLPPPYISPLLRDGSRRNSLWNRLLKRDKSFTTDSSSRDSSSSDLSPLRKMFASPAKRTNSTISLDPPTLLYDTTSVRGIGCMPR